MNEADRIAALVELEILDSPCEKEFDDLVRLASAVFAAPISLVSLVDERRQWFKASFGTDLKETHRDLSFCSHAIRTPNLFVVEDATTDARFCNNPLVTDDPGIRFYAGLPLRAPNGTAVGTLCVIDLVRRKLTDSQREALTILGAQVEARMESRLKQKMIERSHRENEKLCARLAETTDLFERFMDNGPFAAYIKDADGKLAFYNRFLAQINGVTEQAWIGQSDYELWSREMADEHRRNDLTVLEGGVPVEVEETSPSPNGSSRFWKSYKFPYHKSDGKLMLAGISVDVTREMTHQAELENALRDKA
jgi:PAS domain S-box-containing protein